MSLCRLFKKYKRIKGKKGKFRKADYPLRLVNSLISELQKDMDYGDESFLISPDLFEIAKDFTSVEINFCEFSEIKSKCSLKIKIV